MKPSDSNFESAVFKIFRDQQLTHEGDRLSVTAMSQAWEKARLDAGDLFTTLSTMFESGLLKATPVSESVIFSLTAESARRVSGSARRPSSILRAMSGLYRLRAHPAQRLPAAGIGPSSLIGASA